MLPFALSIGVLSLVQAALVAAPRPAAPPTLAGLRSRWWALTLPGPVAIAIAAIAIDPAFAHALTYLALVAVPPLAAVALALLAHGGRPALGALVVPLFALAWAFQGSLTGQASALALSALACVSLGWMLACVVPAKWLKLGIYAMAAIDALLVAADLLQGPNAVLNGVSPGGFPRLQFVSFGSAAMGFGDLFIAAALGALLSRDRRLQLTAATLTAILALAFDLLFFAVNELPATVPVALTLAILESSRRCRSSAALVARSPLRHQRVGPELDLVQQQDPDDRVAPG